MPPTRKKRTGTTGGSTETKTRRTRRPNRPHPTYSLKETLPVVQSIQDKNAGKPINRVLLAEAMNYAPSTNEFRDRLSSSVKYNLSKGSYSADQVSIADLGARIVSPVSNADRDAAKREAFLSIPLYKRILEHYANNKLPEADFLTNILKRTPYSIEPDWAADVARSFREDAAYLGYLRDNDYLVVEQGSPPETPSVDAGEAEDPPLDSSPPQVPAHHVPPTDAPRSVKFFIAHGKKHPPLDQLTKMLDNWGVRYAVVKDEAHGGRPISEKVAETMKECTAGIFIFTTEDGVFDAEQNPLGWPNLNVVFELGAASLLYGRKIVIFKQPEVVFPSDFNDLGYITFKGDDLKAATPELLNELMKLKAIQIVAG